MEKAKCLTIAERGIRTSRDVKELLASLVSDLLAGRVTIKIFDSLCNAIGKLLTLVELEQRFGTASTGGDRVLTLIGQLVRRAEAMKKKADTPGRRKESGPKQSQGQRRRGASAPRHANNGAAELRGGE